MKKSLLFLIMLFTLLAFGQETNVTITGQITDGTNGQPLPFAYVFIDKTTFVTQTNELGKYSLTNLPLGNLDLRVTFIGYETEKRTIYIDKSSVQEISFKMKPGIDLQDVTVKGKSNQIRKKLLKILFIEIIDNNRFSKKCEITNPEVINFYEDEEGRLRAKTSKPIIIENRALGYRIFQHLEDFSYFG